MIQIHIYNEFLKPFFDRCCCINALKMLIMIMTLRNIPLIVQLQDVGTGTIPWQAKAVATLRRICTSARGAIVEQSLIVVSMTNICVNIYFYRCYGSMYKYKRSYTYTYIFLGICVYEYVSKFNIYTIIYASMYTTFRMKCKCINGYTYVHIYIHIYIYIYTYVYIYIYIYKYIYIYTCIYICIYIYIYIYVCVYSYMHVHVKYLCIHINIHIFKFISVNS
jgi:hypothetical protein